MRYFVSILIFLTAATAMLLSCAKWKDPKPVNLHLTNPYCNDPAAVNYNWGFPGKPDNTICYYPNTLFLGTYMMHDSMYRDTLFIGADSFLINVTISDTSHTKVFVSGFCNTGTLRFTAAPTYVATVDTTVGDTTTLHQGQPFCVLTDTLSGTITKSILDSPTVLFISFQVASDTIITTHTGRAIKQ